MGAAKQGLTPSCTRHTMCATRQIHRFSGSMFRSGLSGDAPFWECPTLQKGLEVWGCFGGLGLLCRVCRFGAKAGFESSNYPHPRAYSRAPKACRPRKPQHHRNPVRCSSFGAAAWASELQRALEVRMGLWLRGGLGCTIDMGCRDSMFEVWFSLSAVYKACVQC